jgi:adenylate cyclase
MPVVERPAWPPPVSMEQITRRLAAVAFADVASWSHLVEVNELRALRGWNSLRTRVIEPLIAAHHGRLVDMAGDAVLVEFTSAVDALHWALDVQHGAHRLPEGEPGRDLALRIGINVGDLIVDGQRLVGDAVNIAARIHQAAAPGEIVVTDSVREHVRQRVAAVFHDLGERRLKNIGRPVRVFRVEMQAASAAAWPSLASRANHVLLALQWPQPEAAVPAWREQLEQQLLAAGGAQVVARDAQRWVLAFARGRDAAAAAMALQHGWRQAGPAAGEAPRCGMQVGELPSGGKGEAAPPGAIAAGLAASALAGEIVATSAVRDGLTPALDADIEDLGERRLGLLQQPLRAWRLHPPSAPAPFDAGPDHGELQPTIAVIPFTEHGSGHGPVGEILAEEVIAALSRSAELSVVSRLSTTGFRGRQATLQQLGAHLGAHYVLSGSYRVSHDQLILTIELADTNSTRVAWARELKGSVAGIIEGREELVDRLVAGASGAIMARELERTRGPSLHSLDTCTLLLGAIGMMHRLSHHDFERAREMLQLVVQRLPRHAVPLAWLAKWHVLRVWQGWSDDPSADTRLALECSRRALDNDPHSSLALAIDGFVHTNLLKRLDVAEQRYDLALQLNPNDAQAWLLKGMLHAFRGEGKPAVRGAMRALKLSPLDLHRYFYDSLAGGAELAAGHYPKALELIQRSLRANRMHASTLRMLAMVRWQLGQPEEAKKAAVELMQVEPSLTVSGWLARSPSGDYPVGKLFAEALRGAGVPA